LDLCSQDALEWTFCELKCEPAHSWSDIFRPTRSLPGATAFAHSWNFLSGNNMKRIPAYTTDNDDDDDHVIIYAYSLLQGS